MEWFTRDDGTNIRVIPGFRSKYRYFGDSVNPKATWSDDDYDEAANAKIAKHKKRVQAFKTED